MLAWICVAGLSLAVLPDAAHASVINFQFNASLQTGALAGTNFSGQGSYDTTGSTGMGQEFLPLMSLNFTIGGVNFGLADIKQGGQAILQNGALYYFTAAYFPPPPSGTSINDIALGFGGPGVIGYSTAPGFNFGNGSYTILLSTPEPGACLLFISGALALAAVTLRYSMR
jgi:hypothetical protein